jgi:hypothetical protein
LAALWRTDLGESTGESREPREALSGREAVQVDRCWGGVGTAHTSICGAHNDPTRGCPGGSGLRGAGWVEGVTDSCLTQGWRILELASLTECQVPLYRCLPLSQVKPQTSSNFSPLNSRPAGIKCRTSDSPLTNWLLRSLRKLRSILATGSRRIRGRIYQQKPPRPGTTVYS